MQRRNAHSWPYARNGPAPSRLAQLAVFAAATVVAGERCLFLVLVGLARHAQAHAGHGLAPSLGYLRVAFLAALQTRALRGLVTHALDRILDRRIDLVLHGAVAC